jgi:hypothetical protein
VGGLVPVYRTQIGLVPYCEHIFEKANSKSRREKYLTIGEGDNVNSNDNVQADRRHSDRFPIEREVRYRVLNKRSSEETGDGKTINISSSGILFTSEHMLLPGRRMELAISWPAQLNNKTALKLVARGRVIRFEGGRAAIEIQQYEFRTQSSQPPIAAPVGRRLAH